MELRRSIKWYAGVYQVSTLGYVINTRTGRILKPFYNTQVYLWFKGRRFNKLLHYLVANAFIPNPDNLKFVVHINGNSADNRVTNLKWSKHYGK